MIGVLGDHPAKRRPWGDLARGLVRVERVGDDKGHAGLPRHHREGGGVEARHEVRKAARHDVVAVEHATAGGRDPDALAEGRTVGRRSFELAHEEVLRPRDAQNIGVDEPEHIDAPGLELRTKSSYIGTHVTSGDESFGHERLVRY